MLPNKICVDVSFRHRSRTGKTDFPQAPRHEQSSMQKQIQLYYSSTSMMADLDLEPQGYVMNSASPGHDFVFLRKTCPCPGVWRIEQLHPSSSSSTSKR